MKTIFVYFFTMTLCSAQSLYADLPELKEYDVEQMDSLLKSGKLHFVVFNFAGLNQDKVTRFYRKYNIGYVNKGCVVMESQRHAANNLRILNYLKKRYHHKPDLPYTPFLLKTDEEE
ncbi:MAG: hypothetical protein WBA16_08500 [Nonlabens sp.]